MKKNKEPLPEWYQAPHRDENGKIIIENSQLYYDDCNKYGGYQASKWVQQGKYNLTPEELEKENERLRKKYSYMYE